MCYILNVILFSYTIKLVVVDVDVEIVLFVVVVDVEVIVFVVVVDIVAWFCCGCWPNSKVA